jgi:hypothetical protein
MQALERVNKFRKINAKTKSQRVEEGASIIAMAFSRVAVAA